MLRSRHQWLFGHRSLPLGERTIVMGIVNVTPDSFSDGGQFSSPGAAINHALQLLDEGADILDIGGESTRPGAAVVSSSNNLGLAGAVSADEELRRILSVVDEVRRLRPEAMISVDTYKAVVAHEVVMHGVEIINDVSGFQWDAQMASTMAELDCGCVMMHTRGLPKDWRTLPAEPNIVEIVCRELGTFAEKAQVTGIARKRIVLDPGFGFGKNFGENYPMLARFEEFAALGFPLLVGLSRKSFLGETVESRLAGILPPKSGKPATPADRLNASVASAVASVLKGAHIVRVHDVKATVEAVAVADEILAVSAAAIGKHS